MMATVALNNTCFMYKQQSAGGNIIFRDSGGLAMAPIQRALTAITNNIFL